MKNEKDIDFNKVLNECKEYISLPENLDLITRAYYYAEEKHDGQYRKSGEPYIIHILHVGYILANLRMSPTTIAAGLLHDVIEDCDVTKDELAKAFTPEIAELVESVTKIGNIEFKDEKEYLAANHRKIFIAMAKDVRVIFIKLVDRLHNMRTLQYQSPEKQQKIAAETLDVYAPIAHRLGLGEIKNELEDISFSYLHRDKYYEIARMVDSRKAERDAQVSIMIENFANLLMENNIKFNIFGRSKHLYSIYKKMTTKHKRFDEILDLLAIRIITETEQNCYEILGHIHANYRPIPGRLKDYIAMPKMNMYQSLHTTIVGEDGMIFEVQIRTYKMDEIAERGVAAHWRYKEGQNRNQETYQKEIEDRLSWLRDFNMITEDIDSDAENYMNLLQKDIFEANVYVMTPKGRVIDLPNGATPIDFAYRIHTEVGHQTVGAIVNGTLVPLNTKLKTGDVVQIRTNKQSTPSEDWLKVVKTAHARNKIRSFMIKKEQDDREHMITKGEATFKEECKRRNIDEKELRSSKRFESVLNQFSVNSTDDLMFAIASKSLSIPALFEKLDTNRTPIEDQAKFEKVFQRNQESKSRSDIGVKVSGIDSMMISLSQCCNPVYGDDIVGYVTKGSGVKVHRRDCPNIANEKSRLIDVHWDTDFDSGSYEAVLTLLSTDRSFLLTDLVTVVSQLKVKLNAVNSEVNDDKVHVTTTMRVVVKDAEHLRNLIANLRKVDSVIRVSRVIL
ncbi:bifunctional (p)ppGpp synthetase/guanosine-3',5'-bis(diphosphate) 3'-pyrophosphohydrolase [Erysipelothrix inopinata]|uniref:GTP diphosphokinase n=1 Tax=Erysipelothrix inopinata TaxID=225084 RepID=A0A7G9RYA4_9FIRM|nr:bifunctional (p)ppGpp synthetase/guanosine-3',5'-bis(diphosphate) 3'-pyrophosphohydrolase [Erysipelothrix inopinata]QNN60579.1 bifunctional (p)ppGpp synthetase/guanosine-3',5'-bis(diphosphate) 3'-pyrophosphohydrolase [Erysipelothrix inopinata]